MSVKVNELLKGGYKKEEIIKAIEKAFRALPEYELWAVSEKFQKCLWKDCPVTSEISPLHAHHYPLTLYEIVEEIVDENLGLSPYEILNITIEKHLAHEVKCITLCKAHHLLYHELTKKGIDVSQYLCLEF